MAEMDYKLTYFHLTGLVEPIRMMYAVAGQKYDDVRIKKEEWLQQKEEFKYDQVSVLELEGKTLAKSNAITRFLAKKFNLVGADDREAEKIDELADILADFRSESRKHFIEKDPEKKAELRKTLIGTTVPKHLRKVESIQEENGGDFLVGQKLTWIDIQYAYFLEMCEVTIGLADYPNLKKLQKTVYETPEIKECIENRSVTEF